MHHSLLHPCKRFIVYPDMEWSVCLLCGTSRKAMHSPTPPAHYLGTSLARANS